PCLVQCSELTPVFAFSSSRLLTLYSSSPRLFSTTFSFFFNDTATTEIYTLSLHDALPISSICAQFRSGVTRKNRATSQIQPSLRSEEHTSELQSLTNLVCRLLLEKKKYTRAPSDRPSPITSCCSWQQAATPQRMITASPSS